MIRRLSVLGALVLTLALPFLMVCGCGTPAQVATGGDQKELDLSKLIVWETQDYSVVFHRRWGGEYGRVATFYDRSGKRLDDLKLGYLCSWWGHASSPFSEGLAVASLNDEKQLNGYVDRAGRVVIEFQFYLADQFSDGRAVVSVNDTNEYENRREGLIDRQGKWIVPAGKYAALESGGDGRWAMRISTSEGDPERWGFLDADGKVVVEPGYTRVDAYREGLALVADGDSRAFIDKQGRKAFQLPDNTKDAKGFSCGRALVVLHAGERRGEDSVLGGSVETELRFGFLASDGTMAIKPVYTAAGSFTEGLAPVSMSHKAKFYEYLDETVDGWFGPPDDGQRWGFVDPAGKLAIAMKFNRVSQFSEGLARARHNGKWGFIDKKGEFVIPPRFEWVESFTNGVALAVLDGMIILIDTKGKTLVNTGTQHAVF